jgi:tRNA(fMet)-specific endonuclease VapC
VAKGLLDTNALVLLGRITQTDTLPDEPLISAITLAELSAGPLVATDERVRASRQALLQTTESSFDPLPFDTEAARAFGGVALSLRQSGRKPTARAYDALIAAVAISNNLPLHTCNPRDFAGIDGLQVIAIPHPASATE